MKPPTKAMVLAAGFGSRMLPLTNDLPKALLPFDNVPLLERTLRMLAGWGVRDVLVNTHHHAEQVMDFVLERAANAPDGLRLQLSHEPDILGTGGALAKASWFFDERPTWLVNADIVAELDPRPLLRAHARKKALATLWMTAEAGPRTVRLEARSGRVADFADADPGSDGTFTFCGLHLLDHRVLNFLPDPPTFGSIITAYRAALAAGHTVTGVEALGSQWADVGTPEQYLDALFPAGSRRKSVVARDATVHAKSERHRCAVWPGATLTAGACARSVIVGRDTRVDGPVERIAVPAALAVPAPLLSELPTWCAKATAVCLDPRGSDRSFIRLQRGRRSAILMCHGVERAENERFVSHAKFLAGQGIDVPEILADLPAHRACLVENLGADELLTNPSRHRLEQAIDLTRRLHAVRVPPRIKLERPFTPSLYRWEADLFLDEFVARHCPQPARRISTIRSEFEALGRRLARQPRVLLHRDLQSTNILFHRGQAHLIDFQGMRLGPAMYDVASLLADPYMDLDADTQEALVARYTDEPSLLPVFSDACIQRLCQALGAYGRLGAHPSTRRFLRHIPSALGQLERALAANGRAPVLHEFVQKAVSTLDPDGYVG